MEAGENEKDKKKKTSQMAKWHPDIRRKEKQI
jgi:hypothetical protein